MAAEQQEKAGNRKSIAAKIALLSTTITILPAGMLAGWLLGYFLIDRLLQTFPWGSIVLTLLGAGAGFYQIIRILIEHPKNGDPASHGQS